MAEQRDWLRWHDAYADPDSALSRRLRVVQHHIRRWLDEHPDGSLQVVSACAGQGHDLLGVLAERDDARRVRALLVEADERNVFVAARLAAATDADTTVRLGDAGRLDTYLDSLPAGLVLLCGVFGNVPVDDIERTVRCAPQLCSPGATVIWTRTRKAPDITPTIRRWFTDAGFAEVAFEAPDDELFSVGVNRLDGEPAAPVSGQVLFEFTVG